MRLVRQRLAVFALVALSGHAGTLASAAIALGCRTVRVEAAVEDECCPSGSHPGVMCPMKSKGRAGHAEPGHTETARDDRNCRLICANQNPDGLLLVGAGAVPPEPLQVAAPGPTEFLAAAAHEPVFDRFIIPPSPPPRV